MSLGGVILLVLLAAAVFLVLIVAAQAQAAAEMELRLAAEKAKSADLAGEVTRLREQEAKVQKIEEVRDERKDTVAAGGFDASLGVLSDIARRGKPKA